MDTSDLANRMKEYEKRDRYYLQKRIPVIVRLDMRAGHTFTRGFKRPFDEVFMKTMQETAKYLCENVMNCKLAYTQSDEVTLLLVDYEKLNTESFFDYRVDKLCSIAASMATMAFNRFFEKNVEQESCIFTDEWLEDGEFNPNYKNKDLRDLWLSHKHSGEKGAMFDARVFNIPKEEVTNCIYWRQLDASRNSIQMVGQANFSHRELQNKSCNDIQDMLMTQKGINWNDFPTYQKRGSCVIKEEYFIDSNGNEVENDFIADVDEPVKDVTVRTRWIIDKNIPIFKGEGREYIEKLVIVGE